MHPHRAVRGVRPRPSGPGPLPVLRPDADRARRAGRRRATTRLGGGTRADHVPAVPRQTRGCLPRAHERAAAVALRLLGGLPERAVQERTEPEPRAHDRSVLVTMYPWYAGTFDATVGI